MLRKRAILSLPRLQETQVSVDGGCVSYGGCEGRQSKQNREAKDHHPKGLLSLSRISLAVKIMDSAVIKPYVQIPALTMIYLRDLRQTI